jgi:hypothetical protein
LRLWPLRIFLEKARTKGDLLSQWVLLAFCTALLIIPAFLVPDPAMYGTHQKLLLPPCIFHYVTHVPCLFCGSTTSFAWLVRGNLPAAFLANPLAPVVFLYLVFFVLILTHSLLTGKTVRITTRLSLWGGLWLFLVMWGIKLLVWYFQKHC